MSSLLSNIKTESRPIWEQPPPPYIVLPELPPEDPSRQMTLIEYLMLASAPEIERQTWASVGRSCENKQLLESTILHCFTEVPPLGKRRVSQYAHDLYPVVAIKVWKRIGILYSQHVVSGCLLAAKGKLQGRMRWLIMPNKLSKEKVEEKMWEWPLYLYMRTYFHEEYEKQLRVAALKDKNEQPFVFELEDKEFLERPRHLENIKTSIPTDNIEKESPAPSALKRTALLQVKQEEEEEPAEKIPQLETITSGSSLVFLDPSRQQQPSQCGPSAQGVTGSSPGTSGSSKNISGRPWTNLPEGLPSPSGSKRLAILKVKQEEGEPIEKIPQFEPNTSGSFQVMPAPSHQHQVVHFQPSRRNMTDASYQQAQTHHVNQSGFLQQRDPLAQHQNMSCLL
ncbi:hypothetical protein CRE_17755 [Caenorhabditis remanei]|uniref:Uncharacterized protein n=1 Tax=Caenorhabditis remanei TaxID=31234 RepID=E3NS44_CAERE|nr:hypothetical protein CRE_17755 [Caenorhabditis remanei]